MSADEDPFYDISLDSLKFDLLLSDFELESISQCDSTEFFYFMKLNFIYACFSFHFRRNFWQFQ
jgi:hypothetical protein